MSTGYCDICGGIRWGHPQKTNDFYCKGHQDIEPAKIPQPVPTGERMFTLDEVLFYGAVCAVQGRDMNPVEWFKDKYGIDITKTDNQ